MKHVLFLAWNYLRYHRVKTLFLLFAISLTFFIPMALDRLSEHLFALRIQKDEADAAGARVSPRGTVAVQTEFARPGAATGCSSARAHEGEDP